MRALQRKLQPVVSKVSKNCYLQAIMNGMMTILPAILIGAIGMLLTSLPIPAYQAFIEANGIKPFLALPATMTTNVIALYTVFFIANNLAKELEKDGVTAGLIALISFLIVTPIAKIPGPRGPVDVLPFDWLGATGMFVAIIIGLVAARLYVFITDKGLTIKMPEGVPPTVEKSFAALIPGFIIVILFVLLAALFAHTPMGSLHQLVYGFIQVPLQGLGGSLGAMLVAVFVMHLLWILGIHGIMAILSIMMPIWLPLDIANLNAYGAGQPLPNIVGFAFLYCYVLLGGSGATLGFNLLMLKAKSKRFKVLGRMSILSGICGINEPVIFGTPVVLNPILAIPFITAPIVCTIIAYVLTVSGIVPQLMGTMLPLGMPPFISGFLEGSWKIVALQVVLIIVTTLIYYPFYKMLDNNACKEEIAEK